MLASISRKPVTSNNSQTEQLAANSVIEESLEVNTDDLASPDCLIEKMMSCLKEMILKIIKEELGTRRPNSERII